MHHIRPAEEGSTAGFLFRGVALGCGDGDVLTTTGGSPNHLIAIPCKQMEERKEGRKEG